MSGFCGWITTRSGTPEADRTLRQMTAGLPQSNACMKDGTAAQISGLAIRSHPREGSWFVNRDLQVAIEGYPYWSDEQYARTAKDRGHAHALAGAFADRGEALFDVLHGPFSFAILDGGREKAIIAIDRFGIHPLCYARLPGNTGLVFGSTTDSVRAHPSVAATIRLQSLYDYFYFVDRIPAPDTIYEEQKKLAPGEYLLFEGGRTETKTYWSMPYVEDGGTGLDRLAGELRERLRTAMTRSIAGENPETIGTFLSGGLDSSTVIGFLAQQVPDRPRSFTIGFDDKRFDESRYASLACRHFGADHEVFELEPHHALDAISKISRAFDEPFGNSSTVPAYYCALQAKNAGMEVMLAGDGGDELFAGNSRYLKDAVFDHYKRIPEFLRRAVVEPVTAGFGKLSNAAPFRKAGKYVRLANMSAAARMTVHNLYETARPGNIFTGDLLAAIDTRAPIRFVEKVYSQPASRSKLHRMLHLDLRITLADGDLRKVGRMCELAGVRVRYPLLDEGLAEFSARIPPEMLTMGGRLRHFYKQALKDFLPAEILAKPKHGFGLPYLSFVRTYDPLKQLACDSIETLKGRGYFRKDFLDGIIRNVQSDVHSPFDEIIWDLIVLEQWLESRV